MGAPSAAFGRRGVSAKSGGRRRRLNLSAAATWGEDLSVHAFNKLLFSFDGRIDRGAYWACKIGVAGALGLIVLLANSSYGHSARAAGTHESGTQLAFFLTILAVLLASLFVYFRISVAVQVKRWHDRGRSWHWVFLGLIPVVGWIWQEIECGFLEGDPATNRFGLSPQA
jgi:uncharacterized membrane protein YhaH (DUF805 family)